MPTCFLPRPVYCQAPGQEHIYLVGTEEGVVHKCSKAYSSQYLSTYMAHHLSVYAVKWNYLHHKIFLSASADWSVKLWDSTQTSSPVMTFDLNDSVSCNACMYWPGLLSSKSPLLR